MNALAELTFAGPKTPRGSIGAAFVRDLAEADMALLATNRGIQAPLVKRLHDRHHALARYLALGYSKTDCHAMTGYTLPRISILQNDPSFQMLVKDYREIEGAAVDGFQDRALTLAETALNELQDRMEERADEMSESTLLQIAGFARDTAGRVPVSKTMNTNVNLNIGDRLSAARQRVSAQAAGALAEGAEPRSRLEAPLTNLVEGNSHETESPTARDGPDSLGP